MKLRGLQREKKLFILCGAFIVFCIFIINWETIFEKKHLFNEPFDYIRKTKLEIVNLAIFLRESKQILRSITLVKSILYYCGKLNTSHPSCKVYLDENSRCFPSKMTKPSVKVVLHLVTDNATLPLVQKIWKSWDLRDFDVRYYIIEKELQEKISRTLNHPDASKATFMKMVVTNTLPKSIKTVAVLDTAILLNANIYWLWQYFDNFNASQSIGIVRDQSDSHCMTTDKNHFRINTGLMLYRLDNNINPPYETPLKFKLDNSSNVDYHLLSKKQKIMEQSSKMYYFLPCTWNMQVYFDGTTECCPIIWPIRNPDEQNCYKYGDRVVNLVHYNKVPKPDVGERENIKWTKPRNYENFLNVVQLRRRFGEASAFFRSIPINCFK